MVELHPIVGAAWLCVHSRLVPQLDTSEAHSLGCSFQVTVHTTKTQRSLQQIDRFDPQTPICFAHSHPQPL